jgi:hypothetical protein
MARELPINFRIYIPEPVEVKMVSLNLTVRDAISPLERFKGLFTYVIEDDTFYYLSNGITNHHWKPIVTPGLIEILDDFTDGKQTIISGYGLKEYLSKNHYSKQEVDNLLEAQKIPDHIASITQEDVNKLKTIQGDISIVTQISEPKSTWLISHPENKSVNAFNLVGIQVYGRKTNISSTLTAFSWTNPLAGYVEIN